MKRRPRKKIWTAAFMLALVVSVLPAVLLGADAENHGSHDDWKDLETYYIDDDTDTVDMIENSAYVFLDDAVVLADTIFIGNGTDECTVTLCLNGKSLSCSGSTAIYVNDKATLTLCDCDGNGKISNCRNPDDGAAYGINVSANGTFNFVGGKITDCDNGVYNNGTFAMSGGTAISNCSASGVVTFGTFTMSGGTIEDIAGEGVYIGGDEVSHGEFTMSGGTITNCCTEYVSDYHGAVGVGGGKFIMKDGAKITENPWRGVVLYNEGSSFEMQGGEISKNTTSGNGGGVLVGEGCTFTMTNGTISENTAAQGGGGVLVGGTFIMDDGTISNNDSEGDNSSGGGVLTLGIFIMNGGNITENEAYRGGGVSTPPVGPLYQRDASFTMNGGNISDNEAAIGGGVYAFSSIAVPTGIPPEALAGQDFPSFECHLLGGKISGNKATARAEDDAPVHYGGGGIYWEGVHQVGMSLADVGNVEISNNTAADCGGGIFLSMTFPVFKEGNTGALVKLTARGVNLLGNEAGIDGGGLYIQDGAFVLTDGGEISYNEAGGVGGGVYVRSRAYFDQREHGIEPFARSVFELDGGTLYGNQAVANGGGVYMEETGDVFVSGGTILGNVVEKNGTVSANNVYLEKGRTITVTDELESGTKIGVRTAEVPSDQNDYVAIARSYRGELVYPNDEGSAYNKDLVNADAAKIVSDNPGYSARALDDGALHLYIRSHNNAHPICGIECVDGDHNALAANTWVPWSRWDGTVSGSKYVYLDSDVLLEEKLTIPSGSTLHLCLNGYILEDDHNYLDVQGKLILCDCFEEQIGGSIVGDNGVSIPSGAEVTLYSGKITHHMHKNTGGGVDVEGTFNMYGGSIYKSADEGVDVDGGMFNLVGGSITESGAGGVLVRSGTFNLDGAPTITDNVCTFGGSSIDADVVLHSGQKITVGNIEQPDEPIGVVLLNGSGDPTEGVFTNTWPDERPNFNNYFFSGADSYAVAYDGDAGALKLVRAHAVKFMVNGELWKTFKVVQNAQDKKINAPTPNVTGHSFKGWYENADYTGSTFNFDTQIERDYTLYAKLEPYTFTVKFDANGGTGTMDDIEVTYGTNENLPLCSFTNTTAFEYWKTSDGITYTDGADVSRHPVTEDDAVVTLTAQWKSAAGQGQNPDADGPTGGPAGGAGGGGGAPLKDTDGDGVPDILDEDDDNDGLLDYEDPNPLVPDNVVDLGDPCEKFEDIDRDSWYHEYIDYVVENDLMIGISETLFDPNGTTTRAQAVMLMWRLEDSPVVSHPLYFSDVQSGAWYIDALRWTNSENIVIGYDNGKFGTNDPVTREQIATILWRYARFKGIDTSSGENTSLLKFSDAKKISAYAISALQWACGEEIIEGTVDKTGNIILDPQGSATRAQIAAILMRFCENIL